MTQRAKINRSISDAEVAVIRAALERAPVAGVAVPSLDGLHTLRAVDRCGCGCDSVDFALHDPAQPSKPLADGIGLTPTGGMVGVLVWGREAEVTGLEIYDLGAGDDDLRLPSPTSIQPFDGGAS
jgi:hypothetical protein